jgi:hypothetical protein
MAYAQLTWRETEPAVQRQSRHAPRHPITHKYFFFLKQVVRREFGETQMLQTSLITYQKYIQTGGFAQILSSSWAFFTSQEPLADLCAMGWPQGAGNIPALI